MGTKVQGSTGPSASGVASFLLRCTGAAVWKFGIVRKNLHKEFSLWSGWIANELPPSAALRALNAKRGVRLDKEP